MYSKTLERPYSKADIAKLKKIGKEIKALQKEPGFKEAIKDFIKHTL